MQDFEFVRRSDWAARLSAYLVDVAGRSFRPGVLDCALFAAGGIEAMTGTDPAAGFRGKYQTLADGRAMIDRAGFTDPVEMAVAWCDEVAPAFAHVGDIVTARGTGDRAALGILQGPSAFFLRPSGLVSISRLSVERAFRI